MNIRFSLFVMLMLGFGLLMVGGCSSSYGGPQELLDKYFSSAIKQDYATTYTCYYAAYKQKVNVDEYIKHRKEASALQSYKIISLKQDGDKAQAEVELTFGPSEKLNRKEPITTKVTEELIKEKGEWKIKVW
jgi:hypothetical protein